MLYRGKSIDTFEDAVNMLLANSSYSPIPYADCVSMRAFAFQINMNDWRNWIIPYKEPAAAIQELMTFCGLAEQTTITPIREAIDIPISQGCMLGPVQDKAPHGIQPFYYEGQKKYLYVWGKGNGIIMVHDPDGFPMRKLKMKQFYDEYGLKGSIAVALKADGRQKNGQDYGEVLRKGILYRTLWEDWSALKPLWSTSGKKAGRIEQISLSFGLYNYLLQTCKIIQMAEKASDVNQKYRNILDAAVSAMYQSILNRNIYGFIKCREHLFSVLEKQWM